jgi:hypothetical protein
MKQKNVLRSLMSPRKNSAADENDVGASAHHRSRLPRHHASSDSLISGFAVELLVDENGNGEQQFEEARATWLDRKAKSLQTPEQACAVLLRNIDTWQPMKVPATPAERDAIKRLFESTDNSEPCAAPRRFVERWLIAGERVDPASLNSGDDDERLVYLPTPLWQAICRSAGVWIDGDNSCRTIRVQLKQTPARHAVLLVPRNTTCSDVVLRACATMCERGSSHRVANEST